VIERVRLLLEKLGVQLVKLDLPFRLNHVNCFLAEGEDGWVVIDAGLHNEATIKRWEQALAGKTVTDLYVSHYHPDHFGYIGGLQQKMGVESGIIPRVSMSKVDAEAGLSAWSDRFVETFPTHYKASGIPDDIAAKMLDNTVGFIDAVTPYPDVNHYFQEGEMVPIGSLEYEVIFTPGHSDGLVNFFNEEQGVLFSTDHILPRITPNISYWFHGNPNPLAAYFDSLEKLKKRDAHYVIPSHGQPFYGANDRIEEIKSHHDDRLVQTLDSIRGGNTVYGACQHLFTFQLTIHETRFAIGETLAHLEYLRAKGECTRENQAGEWWYSC